MYKKYFTTLLASVLILISTQLIFSQTFKVNDFAIRKSNFQDDLVEIKTQNSNLTVEEFIPLANELLQKKGVNYVFGFDAGTCQKIVQVKASQKDKTAPLNLRASLTSVGGDGQKTSLTLPEASFEKSQCVPCYMQLPVFEITPIDFVTSILGANIKFNLPANFVTHEIQLVDNADVTKVIKTWKIPFIAEPLSISNDGNIIYLGFPNEELKDVTLLMFGEGTFSIGARKEINPDKKISRIDSPSNLSDFAYSKFQLGDNIQTVKYKKSCDN